MRSLILIAVAVLSAASCSNPIGGGPPPLSESLAEIAAEVNEGVADLFDTLDEPYDDRSQLYTRLIDLRLPNRFAIQLDKAQRVESPVEDEAILDRYIEFLQELLFTSEQLDAAIATGEPAGTALAAVGVEASAGALAVVLPSGPCQVMVPLLTRDLCPQGGLDGYERSLDFEIRRFVASFRPAFRIPATFGDVIRARVLGNLQGDATRVLLDTGARIEALQPGPAYERLQQILVGYFRDAAEVWSEFPADPAGSDPLLYEFLTGNLEDVRDEARRDLQVEYEIVRAANADSQIVEILGIWFDPPVTESAE